MERILASVKVKHKDGKLEDGNTLTTAGRDGEIDAINGACKSSGAANPSSNSEPLDLAQSPLHSPLFFPPLAPPSPLFIPPSLFLPFLPSFFPSFLPFFPPSRCSSVISDSS